ncbi:MAG: D-tyrosyl-tRNA(Tyr) deacylase [Lachnospiraceae bacterium]|nr:D-tyrosyl-tRNA(Tyr) deacylase [Lachnospiraceae bacterium]
MKFVIQIAEDAKVEVNNKVTGSIDKGYMVLVGIGPDDTKEIADKMVKKMLGLRIFPDENDKINLNLNQVGGELLLVSQFTLYADCSHGNRPSFVNAAKPDLAENLYNYVVDSCRNAGYKVGTGIFGEEMKVTFSNIGPFTIVLDSEEIFK